MNAFLMAVTVTSALVGNSFKNIFSKSYLKNQTDNLAFNLVGHALVILLLALFGGAVRVSRFTLLTAAGMGVCNLLSGLLFSLCLTCGPMALTTLVQLGISLVVSALLGPVFWKEGITLFQAAGIVLILVSMVLTSNAKVDKNISFKWLVLTVVCGFTNSTLGLFQKILTTSAYKNEQMGFLFYAFIICSVCNLIWFALARKKAPSSFRFKGISAVCSLVCGLSMGAQHIINLKLVGELPTAVFFPICTGLRILLTALIGIILFKEKLSKRQLIGFVIGFSALFLVAGIFG